MYNMVVKKRDTSGTTSFGPEANKKILPNMNMFGILQ